ncbi:MAG: hypothetical protein WBC83_03515, partial [Minisyncoccia bacterium]
LLVIASITVLIVVTFVMYKQSVDKVAQPLAEQTVEKQNEQQKTDFGSEIPSDFPTDIPIEEGAEVEQSYNLNYTGQNQLTIVFPSTKTVKENYALYSDFLEKQNWIVSNKYESEKLSSIYGTKESNDINVTIGENVTDVSKSLVSISILKK